MVGKSNRTKEEKASIVMDVLSNSATIAEICRRHNVTSSALYAWRDAFISGGTAALEPGKYSKSIQPLREIEHLKTIIGNLTIANETLKNIQSTRRGGMQ